MGEGNFFMSIYGEAIISRLPLHSVLHDTSHPMNQIIQNTIGEWLDHYDVVEWFHQFFVTDATGAYLDLHGKQYGVKRKIDESDEDYRQRIVYAILKHLTVNYLIDVYDVQLYTRPSDTFVSGSTLVSDNPYILNDTSITGFLGVAPDESTENTLNKKFVIEDVITWL